MLAYELSDFGTPLGTSRPPGMVDVIDRLVHALEGFADQVGAGA